MRAETTARQRRDSLAERLLEIAVEHMVPEAWVEAAEKALAAGAVIYPDLPEEEDAGVATPEPTEDDPTWPKFIAYRRALLKLEKAAAAWALSEREAALAERKAAGEAKEENHSGDA